jgi:serine/threonine protein kinase
MSDSDRTVLAPRSGVAAGTRLNGIYEIESLIAVGGMGEVYKGRAIQTGDAVAIKMIRPEMARDEAALALFRREAAALHNLYNEAIVRYYVFTIDPVTQSPYLAMEFVDGQPLSERIKQGPLTLEEADVLRRRIAPGLHAAHLLGIVHRDVSPDNIILPGGNLARAKIIDFGIARSSLLGEGTVIGSGFAGKYNYVSPEQLGLYGGDVTGRSDMYSFGLVLAEALAGKPLDMGGTQVQILDKRRRVPDLSAVDARIRPLLTRMLAADPAERLADMAEVAAWQPKAAAPATSAKSRLPLRAFAGIAIAALLAGGGFYLWTALTPATAPRIAQSPAEAPPALSEPSSGTPGQSAQQGKPPELSEPPAKAADAGPAAARDQPPAASGAQQQTSAPQIAARTEPQPETPQLRPPVPEPAKPEPAKPQPAMREPPPREPARTGPSTPPPDAQQALNEQRTPPAGAAIVVPPPIAQPEREPRTPAERIERFVRDYDGGPCFFLWPIEIAEKKATLEGFGSGAEPFVAFDTAFKNSQGFEAQIHLRPVTAAQCPMVDFLRQLGSGIDRSPRLQIGAFNMKSGDVLSGSIEAGGGQNLDVVLIGDDGLVYSLASYLKREGAKATFNLKLESTGGAARPQTVLALVSQAPLPVLSGPNPAPASDFFANLRQDIARQGGKLGLGVKYFRIE